MAIWNKEESHGKGVYVLAFVVLLCMVPASQSRPRTGCLAMQEICHLPKVFQELRQTFDARRNAFKAEYCRLHKKMMPNAAQECSRVSCVEDVFYQTAWNLESESAKASFEVQIQMLEKVSIGLKGLKQYIGPKDKFLLFLRSQVNSDIEAIYCAKMRCFPSENVNIAQIQKAMSKDFLQFPFTPSRAKTCSNKPLLEPLIFLREVVDLYNDMYEALLP